MSDCEVCYATSANKSCVFCKFNTCNSCIRRYTLESTIDPHCMNCKKGFTHDHIITLFPKTWLLKEFKNRRETILVEREKALLPSTQPAVTAEITRRNNVKLLSELKLERKRLQNQLTDIRIEIYNVERAITNGSNAVANAERPVYTYRCPDSECRGFLNISHICGTCNTHFCNKCNERTDQDHECDQELVDTFKLLQQNTKPCPSCNTLIFKDGGCSQMFCTNPECHTAFDWKTGQIETRNIHNPHYYEYIRNNNAIQYRQPGDEVCGGLPYLHTLARYARIALLPNHIDIEQTVYDLHRTTQHVNRIELINYRTDIACDNNDLRVKYLLKEIDYDNWKKLLQRREKSTNKKRDMYQILSMFDETATHLFISTVAQPTKTNFEKLCDEMKLLMHYCNKSIEKLEERYNNKLFKFAQI